MTSRSEHGLPLTVRETLDTVMAPAVRNAVLDAALQEAGHSEVPTDPDEFRRFLDGALSSAIVRALGQALGESIADELGRLVAAAGVPPSSTAGARASANPERRITSQTRPHVVEPELDAAPVNARSSAPAADEQRRRTAPQGVRLARVTQPSAQLNTRTPPVLEQVERVRTAPTGMAPPSSASYPRGIAETLAVRGTRTPSQALPRQLPYVLVATRDAGLVQQLSSWLDPRAAVLRVSSVMSLLSGLQDASGSPLVIIVDCRQPAIRPVALAALADELPPGVQVVMWGAPPEVERQVVFVAEAARNWFVCSAHAEAKDVAERCAELLK
jgi:hypothetical protein